MRRFAPILLAVFITHALGCAGATNMRSTTRILGPQLALRGAGAADSDNWKLTSNGFVGTYVHLDSPNDVEIELEAMGTGAARPRVNVAIDDSKFGFDLENRWKEYQHQFALPEGTHFVRVEFVKPRRDLDQSVLIRALRVTGAKVLNEHTDANALAAADTYIEHFRKVPVTVHLPGVARGTSVRVKLVRSAFNFGANAPGVTNKLLIENPPPGSDADKFQQFIVGHFNMLVPSNAGKWAYQEPTAGKLELDYADTIMRFARSHGLRARMHNLIWATNQQPKWVTDLLTAAAAGDGHAKDELRRAISRRIQYYVRERANDYVELDVLNESLHRGQYWQVFGAKGIAEIYNEVADAVRAAGSSATLYLNEFNVLQWSQEYPFRGRGGTPDPYANWYRAHVEELIEAGGVVSGIGVQYYADSRPEAAERSPHSAARIFAALQNLSIPGLPISLTEFAIKSNATPEQAALIYDQTMRVLYGTPLANSFLTWGFWAGAVAPSDSRTALVDNEWKITPAGRAYERLLAQWNTDVTLTADANSNIHFAGGAGEYVVTVGDKSRGVRVEKGTSIYEVTLP